MNNCFHCQGTRRCDCLACGRSVFFEGRPIWMSGACAWCEGRQATERHRAILDAIDPRENHLWIRHPAHDGRRLTITDLLPYAPLTPAECRSCHRRYYWRVVPKRCPWPKCEGLLQGMGK
jgi:hypothetical protein